MDEQDRKAVYLRDRSGLTAAQRRRLVHKRGHSEAAARRADVREALRPVQTLHLPYSRLFLTPDGRSSVELKSSVREVKVHASGLKTRTPISARNLRRLIAKGKLDHER
jgi:hypothetical protein